MLTLKKFGMNMCTKSHIKNAPTLWVLTVVSVYCLNYEKYLATFIKSPSPSELNYVTDVPVLMG